MSFSKILACHKLLPKVLCCPKSINSGRYGFFWGGEYHNTSPYIFFMLTAFKDFITPPPSFELKIFFSDGFMCFEFKGWQGGGVINSANTVKHLLNAQKRDKFLIQNVTILKNGTLSVVLLRTSQYERNFYPYTFHSVLYTRIGYRAFLHNSGGENKIFIEKYSSHTILTILAVTCKFQDEREHAYQ